MASPVTAAPPCGRPGCPVTPLCPRVAGSTDALSRLLSADPTSDLGSNPGTYFCSVHLCTVSFTCNVPPSLPMSLRASGTHSHPSISSQRVNPHTRPV